MGLKTTNYHIEDIGITVPNAYAQVTHINVNLDGTATAMVQIQQTREDIGIKAPLSTEMLRCNINKDLPLYTQVYEAAKLNTFKDWEDDIVEVETTVTEE